MKNENCGVYAIINLVNQKMYIGSSKNLSKRKSRHFARLKNNTHGNDHMQSAFNKYNSENFEFKILKLCKEKDLLKEEQVLINKYNSTNRDCGYNIVLRTDRTIVSEEIRRKISKTNKGNKNRLGYKTSEETKRKISEANKGNKNTLGYKHSEEAKRNMSEAQRGHICSSDAKRKTSEALKGREVTKEHRRNLSKAKKGKKLSEHHKEMLSISHKKYRHFEAEWQILYGQGLTFNKIAKKYKVNHKTVKRYLKINP